MSHSHPTRLRQRRPGSPGRARLRPIPGASASRPHVARRARRRPSTAARRVLRRYQHDALPTSSRIKTQEPRSAAQRSAAPTKFYKTSASSLMVRSALCSTRKDQHEEAMNKKTAPPPPPLWGVQDGDCRRQELARKHTSPVLGRAPYRPRTYIKGRRSLPTSGSGGPTYRG